MTSKTRKGWVLEQEGADPDPCSLYGYYPIKIYTDKQLALTELKKQFETCIFKSFYRLVEVDLVEDDNYISNSYNQIEQESSSNIKEWLTTLSICSES